LHQRIAEVRLHAAQRNTRVQRERIVREAAGQAARHILATVAVGVRYTDVAGKTGRSRHADRFVERNSLSTIRAAALIFFATVEDAKPGPDHGLVVELPCQSDARSDVKLVPGDQIVVYLAAGYLHVRV